MVVTIGPSDVLASRVAEGDVPGVVALAANRDGVMYSRAFGERQLGSGVEMTLDTVFWIASMTKAVTSVASLISSAGRLSHEPWRRFAATGQCAWLEGFRRSGEPRLRHRRGRPPAPAGLTPRRGS